MIHSRRKMCEDTIIALNKARRKISKLDYTNFDKAKDIEKEVYEEFKDNEWFEKITYTDKMAKWLKKRKQQVWLEYLKQIEKKGKEK